MPGKLDGTGIVEAAGGSTIVAGDVQAPGDLRGVRGDGIGFGPLRLTGWAESTTVIQGLSFDEAEADSWLPFLSAAGIVGAAAHEDTAEHRPLSQRTALTRRGFLVTVGATTLAVGTATAQTDDGDGEQTYNVASFDLLQNLRGLKVDVDVAVAEWLDGEDVEFFLSADGSTIGTFDAGEPGKTVTPGTTGTVELESDTALTLVQRLIAKARADDTVVFEFRPQDTSFAAETVDDEIVLATEPVVVETVASAAPTEILLRLNGTIIPHTNESGSKPAGEWYVRDESALVYVVGPDTPDTSLVEVQANVGTLDRLWQEYGW